MLTDATFAHPDIPPDVEAGAYVAGVEHATDALADAVNDPLIRASLTGLDALALEKVMERIAIIVEEIDRHG